MIQIREISAEETYEVRLELLRNNSPISHEFEGDHDATTFHIGALYQGEVVAISSYMKATHSQFTGNQYQLRGMATLEKFQGRGIGKKLLQTAEKILKKRDVEILWCNARVLALNFYKKQGFIIVGKRFDIPHAGIHYVMFKDI